MNLTRILKTSGAIAGGQAITVVSQLALPPLFIRSYGVAGLGEWLTLTAAVSYLGTLNFGLQTFANNQAGIACNRGEIDEVRELQATAFGFLLAVVALAAALTTCVFSLPLGSWLRLKTDPGSTSLTVYLLGLQVIGKIIFSFLAGSFLAAGSSHRGINWNSLLVIVTLAGTCILAFLRASFASIAAMQFAVMALFAVLVFSDLRINAPAIAPRLSCFQASKIKELLKPSGYFAMLSSSNFLAYQLPLIVMQRMLGPEKVVVFSLTRTIYSMSRQILNSVSTAMGPEINELYGQRNWTRLFRLYDVSERIVFSLVPILSVGTFLATPFLISLWLHRTDLYDIPTCIFMAMISAVMGTKEHKYQFQTSSNEHRALSQFWFFSYCALVVLSLPAIYFFGVGGFLALWLITEAAQLSFVMRLNRKFFAHFARLNYLPLYRMGVLLLAAMCASAVIAFASSPSSMAYSAAVATGAVAVLSVIAYPLFELNKVSGGFLALLGRVPPIRESA